MTIAFFQSTGNDAGTVTGSTGTTLTLPSSSGAGDQGIVMLRIGSTTGNPVITDNGSGGSGTWNSFKIITDSTNGDQLIGYLCINLKTATTVITCKFTGSSTVRWAYHEYTVAPGAVLATDQEMDHANASLPNGAGGTITSNATATTTNPNELLLGYYKTEVAQSNGSATANNSFNIREQRSKLFTADNIVTSESAYTASWTTATGWALEASGAVWAVIQTFFESGGSAASSPTRILSNGVGGSALSLYQGNQLGSYTKKEDTSVQLYDIEDLKRVNRRGERRW